jgi:hypothetical protein
MTSHGIKSQEKFTALSYHVNPIDGKRKTALVQDGD